MILYCPNCVQVKNTILKMGGFICCKCRRILVHPGDTRFIEYKNEYELEIEEANGEA